MAAKDTVANFFGGITIFTDKPFKINDRVKIGGFDGTITEIGIRSTRLKTLENRIVTIPNSKFTDGMVENVSSEPHRKVMTSWVTRPS
jgi:MscS family membrane protein